MSGDDPRQIIDEIARAHPGIMTDEERVLVQRQIADARYFEHVNPQVYTNLKLSSIDKSLSRIGDILEKIEKHMRR